MRRAGWLLLAACEAARPEAVVAPAVADRNVLHSANRPAAKSRARGSPGSAGGLALAIAFLYNAWVANSTIGMVR